MLIPTAIGIEWLRDVDRTQNDHVTCPEDWCQIYNLLLTFLEQRRTRLRFHLQLGLACGSEIALLWLTFLQKMVFQFR